jgi:phosphate transport system substrate-binding protein
VKGFVDFYVNNDGKIAEAAKYVPLNDEQKAALKTAAAQLGGG